MSTAPREDELVREIKALDHEGLGLEALRKVRDQLQAVHALKTSLSMLSGETTPEQAHRVQATENAWRAMDKDFGLLNAGEVAERCGSKSIGRTSYATDARRSGRIMAVKRLNRLLYPAFQFSAAGPIPLMRDLKREADRLDIDEETTLLWMTAPTTWWDEDSRPVDHLDDPEGITAAFRSHYGAAW